MLINKQKFTSLSLLYIYDQFVNLSKKNVFLRYIMPNANYKLVQIALFNVKLGLELVLGLHAQLLTSVYHKFCFFLQAYFFACIDVGLLMTKHKTHDTILKLMIHMYVCTYMQTNALVELTLHQIAPATMNRLQAKVIRTFMKRNPEDVNY